MLQVYVWMQDKSLPSQAIGIWLGQQLWPTIAVGAQQWLKMWGQIRHWESLPSRRPWRPKGPFTRAPICTTAFPGVLFSWRGECERRRNKVRTSSPRSSQGKGQALTTVPWGQMRLSPLPKHASFGLVVEVFVTNYTPSLQYYDILVSLSTYTSLGFSHQRFANTVDHQNGKRNGVSGPFKTHLTYSVTFRFSLPRAMEQPLSHLKSAF